MPLGPKRAPVTGGLCRVPNPWEKVLFVVVLVVKGMRAPEGR